MIRIAAAWSCLIGLSLICAPAVRAGDADGWLAWGSRTFGISRDLLEAIAHVETGGSLYALRFNRTGVSFYPERFDAAERILASIEDDNVDIGLMQVNYGIWGKRLGLSKRQLLHPAVNLWAASTILITNFAENPRFWKAVGAYHSPRLDRQRWFAWRVYGAVSAINGEKRTSGSSRGKTELRR